MSYFEDEKTRLILGDTFEVLETIDAESVDMIFADPPYFLSSGGISCSGGKMVSVDKGDWDKTLSVDEKHEFNRRWIRLCRRVLKPSGTIFISGTLHNIFSCGLALEQEGYKILNSITWKKLNPPPNLSCRYFVHSTETVLWARRDEKGKHKFNYELMREINGGKQMHDVIEGPLTPKKEKQFGKHPTQKPEYLLERLILAASDEGDLILDPFCGSGTTCAVAKRLKRRSIGIDAEEEYLDIAKKRVESVQEALF